jgi:hypothetical protein
MPKGRVGNQLGLSYFYIMTITIPNHVQYPPPVDGFDRRPFTSVVVHQQSVSAVTTIDTGELSVAADITYSDGTSETGVTVVPELRPFHNAALHVCGQAFVAAIPGLTENRIRRFK